MYRVAVFFWILVGLVWLSGVISLVTEAVKSRGRSFTDFDKSYVSKMQHTCEKVSSKPFVVYKNEKDISKSTGRYISEHC